MKNTFILFFCLLFTSFSSKTFANDTLEQFEAQIASHKGKVVYIDFWASWCVPCRKSFPWLNKMQSEYSDQNFTILSVNLDADPELAKQFLTETPAKFPIFYDPKGKVAKAFKLKGMPSSYIVNKEGKIVSSHVGFTDKKKIIFQQEIIKLLNE